MVRGGGTEGKWLLPQRTKEQEEASENGKHYQISLFLVHITACFSELVGLALSSGEIHKRENTPQLFHHVN